MTWQRTRLKYLAAEPIVNGLGESATLEDESWPRYIRTTDFAGPRTLREETKATLPPAVARKAEVRRGDVLMSAAGTVGKTFLYDSDEPACYAGYLVRFRPTSNVDPRFVAYWTETPLFLDQIETGKVTSTIDNFSASKYQNLSMSIPDRATQRAIADYLDTETARIDALIDKKQRLRDLAVLRSQSRIAFLLDQFDDVPLQHLTDSRRPIVYGIVQAGEHDPEGVPYIKSGDVMALAGRVLSRTSRAIHQQYSRSHVRPGDLVIAMRASIGALARVPDSLHEANLTQGTARIAPARGIDGSWLFYALKLPRVQEEMSLRAVGTTFRTLNIWDLRRIAIPTPPAVDQPALAAQAEQLERQAALLVQKLDEQIQLLRERRQALITATVTGELEVSGVAA